MESTDYERKAEAKTHALAIERAAVFFAAAAKRGELPLTPDEFEERVKEFFTGLETKLGLSNALMMAAWEDRPVPQACYKAWASAPVVYTWRHAEKNPLPVVTLNGKIMIKPSDFFAALRTHGRSML